MKKKRFMWKEWKIKTSIGLYVHKEDQQLPTDYFNKFITNIECWAKNFIIFLSKNIVDHIDIYLVYWF